MDAAAYLKSLTSGSSVDPELGMMAFEMLPKAFATPSCALLAKSLSFAYIMRSQITAISRTL